MDRGTKGETPNPIPAINALIEDEEKNGKKKKQSGPLTQLQWIIWSLLTTRMDLTYSETPNPQGKYIYTS